MRLLFAALSAILALGGVSVAATIEGRVVSVHDGDTLTILDSNSHPHRIRLSQIDAPELGRRHRPGQPYAYDSKRSLAALVYGQTVIADCPGGDRYGRKVCTVWKGGTDISLEQVRRGMAWVYRRYAVSPDYFQAELEARESRRGLWKDTAAAAPWEWRRQ